jgi:hypothetical protein
MLDTFTPTTDLEAVNAILAAANEAPVVSLDAAAGRPDVALALDALNSAIRETLATRWRFNSDINYRIAGTLQGAVYVFPEPANLLAFTLTPTEAQRGLDIVSRPSRTYLVDGLSVRILANRIGGIDTLTQSELFINPIWTVPFSLMPEAARRYIVRAAVRRRRQQSGAPDGQVQAAAADEQAALAALTATEAPQVPALVSDGWGTETDALNAILNACNQPGVVDVLAAEDMQLSALNVLRQSVTDVCSMGWRFNSDKGLGLAPVATPFNWTDIDGTITPVNIFLAPDNFISARATVCDEQLGSDWIDVSIRMSERYIDVNAANVKVIADRDNHRDGFPVTRTVLWLDVTRRVPFANLPEPARRYATIMAGRRVAMSLASSNRLPTTMRWTEEDESQARTALQRTEGNASRPNIFRDNPSVRNMRGRLPRLDLRYLAY